MLPIHTVDPYLFEELVAEVWEVKGFSTTITSGSGDRGIDIIAENYDPFPQKQLIQAKCYSPQNKVGSEEVRKYATLYQQEPDADKVVLATSSSFTSEAQRLAQDLDVTTLNGRELREEILTNKIDLSAFGLLPELNPSRDYSKSMNSVVLAFIFSTGRPVISENFLKVIRALGYEESEVDEAVITLIQQNDERTIASEVLGSSPAELRGGIEATIALLLHEAGIEISEASFQALARSLSLEIKSDASELREYIQELQELDIGALREENL